MTRPITLKGKARPEKAYVLTGMADQTRKHHVRPIVGRGRQLKALRGAFDECVEEQASVLVTVLGVPGIGKSRLVEQLSSELAAESTVLAGSTPTYGEDIAYAPVLDLLQTATGVEDADGVFRYTGTFPDGALAASRQKVTFDELLHVEATRVVVISPDHAIDDFLSAKGTKTVLTEMRDTIGLLMMADGKDITKADPVQVRRGIGYVIQSAGLMPHQRVIDNVATVPVLNDAQAALVGEAWVGAAQGRRPKPRLLVLRPGAGRK